MTTDAILQGTAIFGMGVIIAAFLIIAIRIIRGPTLPDRVLGLDMLVGAGIGFIALIAIKTGFFLYLDIAIALGLVGFLATVAFARFVMRRDRPAGDDAELPPPHPPQSAPGPRP
ncbi:MAG: cation:proton antiporter [Pseudomonadota bacterium]